MTLQRWVAKQKKTAQVDTVTITAADVTTTYKITIGNKVVSTLGAATTALTAAALQAALAASQDGEFQEIAWTNPTAAPTTVVGTAQTWGKPFTLSATVSGGAGTLSLTHTTVNTSPNDVNDAANWSSAVPVNGDSVLIDFGGPAESLWWNLGSLAAVTLVAFTRRRGFTGSIGLPEINTDGTEYTEYRATEFAFNTQTTFLVTVEQPSSDGAGQIKLNTGSTQTVLNVLGDGAGSLGSEALWWRGTHASNVVNAKSCSLAIAPVNANSAVVPTLNADNSTVRCGSGLTLTTLNNRGSTVELHGSLTTLTQRAGTTVMYESGAVTTATIHSAGVLFWCSDGTITTLTLGLSSRADFSIDARARTITNKVNMYGGSVLNDPAASLIAGGFSYLMVECEQSQITINQGPGRSCAVT